MSESLRVSLVTPQREVFGGAAEFVVVPGWDDGEIGFLPGHASYVGTLGIGEMRVRESGGAIRRFAVFEGFVEVSNDTVTVLANRALAASEITQESVAKAREELAALPSKTEAEFDAKQRKRREVRAAGAILRRK